MKAHVQFKIEQIRNVTEMGRHCQITLTNGARFNVATVRSVQAHGVLMVLTDNSDLLIAPEEIVSVRVFRPMPLVSS